MPSKNEGATEIRINKRPENTLKKQITVALLGDGTFSDSLFVLFDGPFA
jgi:negative regulator of sigma E activity